MFISIIVYNVSKYKLINYFIILFIINDKFRFKLKYLCRTIRELTQPMQSSRVHDICQECYNDRRMKKCIEFEEENKWSIENDHTIQKGPQPDLKWFKLTLEDIIGDTRGF